MNILSVNFKVQLQRRIYTKLGSYVMHPRYFMLEIQLIIINLLIIIIFNMVNLVNTVKVALKIIMMI